MSDLSTTKNNVSCNDNSLFFFFFGYFRSELITSVVQQQFEDVCCFKATEKASLSGKTTNAAAFINLDLPDKLFH